MRMMSQSDGRVGWAHPRAQLDDEVFLISGCTMPVILRRWPGQNGHALVGHSYVQGLMDGEFWRRMDKEKDLKDVEIW